MPHEAVLVLRLVLAAGLGAALGSERELTEQPAGFRTHTLVALGAALFAIVSAYGFQSIAGQGPTPVVRADVTRVASQIVVGIGFIGGGCILKYGANVRGLTTAASLWVTAAVGTAIGIGQLGLGIATAVITLVALVGFRPLRKLMRRIGGRRGQFVVQAGTGVDIEALMQGARDGGARVIETRIAEEAKNRTIYIRARLPSGLRPGGVVAKLSEVEEVRSADWKP